MEQQEFKKKGGYTRAEPRPERPDVRFQIDRRTAWFGGAMTFFIICTVAAFMQDAAVNAYEQASFPSLKWWLRPVEYKAPARLPVVENDLRAISAVGARKLWVAGAGDLILHTSDGGRTWERQGIAENAPAAAAGLDLGRDFPWITSAHADEGAKQAAQKQESPVQQSPRRQQEQEAAYDKRADIIPNSALAQDTETPKPPPADSLHHTHLNTIFFLDENLGWAAGNDGRILATTDGGATWTRQSFYSDADINAVFFSDENLGWAAGTDGMLAFTRNGDWSDWQASSFEKTFQSSQVTYNAVQTTPDGQQIVAVGDQGTILVSQNGGQSFREASTGVISQKNAQPLAGVNTFHDLQLLADGSGIAVGSFGSIFTSRNAMDWVREATSISSPLFTVHGRDRSNFWVGSWNGEIYRSRQDSSRLDSLGTGTTNTIRDIVFTSDARGWAVGHRGTLLATVDGGDTWFPQTNIDAEKYSGDYRKTPAPWYYASWLLVAFLLAPGLRKPAEPDPDKVEIKEGVKDVLISDRPLEFDDPDPLDFKPTALGLSRFIRNESTQPPLIIAVSGPWGSGKSSMMNLLQTDLRKNRFQTVWFNAWHHQKEDHLQAAFLENIRQQALPKFWTRQNFRFQFQLIRKRMKQNWWRAGLALAFLGAVAGYALNAGNPLHALSQLQESNWEWENVFKGGALLATLATVLGAGRILWKALRAFGVDPADLMASMSSKADKNDYTGQIGFRLKFRAEFRQVVEALQPYNLVIFIDDLERCKPANVLEILEAVNFLVSSGKCFVVLGVDMDRLQRCVGLGFREEAAEFATLPSRLGQQEKVNRQEEGRRRRAHFAKQYLEKLINLEVKIPTPTQEQTLGLLKPERPPEQRLSVFHSFRRRASEPLRALWPVLVVAGIIYLGFATGRQVVLIEKPGPDTAQQAVVPVDSSASGVASSGREQGGGEVIATVGEVRIGAADDFPTWVVFLPAILILALAIWRLSLPEDVIVKDSANFKQALEIWHPLIYAADESKRTPRAIKIFMNRLRFFAMRITQSEVPVEHEVSEPTLVALTALHHYNDRLLDRGDLNDLISAINGRTANAVSETDIKKLLSKIVEQHQSQFEHWPPTAKEVEIVRNFTRGIRVS